MKPRIRTRKPATPDPAREKKRLLIIKNEAPLLTLLAQTFAAQKIIVFTAENGREGLAMAFRERPDLILIGMQMPEMDGLTILKHLRRDRNKWGRFVPVILLSKPVNPELGKYDGKKLRADDYLLKDGRSIKELIQKVKEKMAGHTNGERAIPTRQKPKSRR